MLTELKKMNKIMGDRSNFLLLIVIMIAICSCITITSTWILYRTAISEERFRLMETAQSQARLIEAIAKFDQVHSIDFPEGPLAATLAQIKEAHSNYQGFGETGEFTLGRKERDQIVFLLNHRHYDLDNPKPVPFNSNLAIPMKLALSGKSGTVIALDYRGEKVLAAHEPVEGLGLGIVAKIDMSEIQSPFFRAISIVFVVMIFLSLIGTWLFLKITNPIIKSLQNINANLEAINADLNREIGIRKSTETKLAESYDRAKFLADIIEKAQQPIGVGYIDGRLGFCNRAFCELTGYTFDELKTMDWANVLTPQEWLPSELKMLKQLEETGQPVQYEKEYIHKNGERIPIELLAHVARKSDGSIDYYYAFITDITERKKFEDSLKKEKDRSQQYLDVAGVILLGLNSEGCIELINKKGCEILEAPRSELIGKNWFDNFLEHDQIESVKSIFSNLMRGEIESVQYVEETIRTVEGRIRIIGWNNSLIKNQAGEITGTLSSGEDITDRKKAEIALINEKERLAVTLKSIGDGVITTDTDGKITLLNKVAEKLTGWTQVEAKGKSISDVFNIINALTRQSCENPVKKVLESKAIIGLANSTMLIAKDGIERMIADSGAPIFDSDSQIIGVVLVFRDVTEKHQIEQQLQQSQKMDAIGTLAGGIAHDFNNMLGIITGNTSYALSRIKYDDELYEVLKDVQNGAKRAQSLTQQLLTFAKGGQPIKETININSLIEEAATFANRGANSKCQFDLCSELSYVDVDEGQINQVINNLIINANQAMPQGGVITVRTENASLEPHKYQAIPPGCYVKITIEDQGVGIPERYLSRIFDPYFSTKQQGSGLGLASSYSIINNHNGHIAVSSILDKGTTFEIFLPVSEQALSNRIKREDHSHTGNGKILILDDEKPILKMTGRILNKMGYIAHFAEDGIEAIKKYRTALESEKPFDLVILDLTVPGGMGGMETMGHLKEIDPAVKAIVSSGYSNDPVMSNYREYGFSGVIPKPYLQDQVARVLNDVLGSEPQQ